MSITETVRRDLIETIQSNPIQKIIDSEDFFFQKAVDKFSEWEQYEVIASDIPTLMKLASTDYQTFKSSDEYKEIRRTLFPLIAYFDEKASDKALYNEYDDKRTIAKAGIRQHAWICQLLLFKQDEGKIKDSVRNIINYIRQPSEHCPIISEVHKEKISKILFDKKQYDSSTFYQDVKDFFESYNIKVKNDKNLSHLYTRLLYTHPLYGIWHNSPIKGLVFKDNTGWQEDFQNALSETGYGVMWKDQISNWDVVIPALQEIIEDSGYVYCYNIAESKVKYRARIIDFATKEDYDEKKNDWEYYSPCWYANDFSEYSDDKRQASIVFLVDAFESIEDDITQDDFVFYDRKPSVRNMVAYIHLNNKKTMSEISEIIQVLKSKLNIILQGAPGTGKTYSTASVALAVVDPSFCEWDSREAIMKRYNTLLFDIKNNNPEHRIAFVTFHQSMDYEDFIIGLKPKLSDSGINYVVADGIFKIICDKARKNPDENFVLIIDEINRGNVSKIFGELITLLEKDKRDSLSAILPYSNESFSVPANLCIIGTMNTTDRSTGTLDYAVRRRFSFITLESQKEKLLEYYKGKGNNISDKAENLFNSIWEFLNKYKVDMDISDLMVGHSYFMAEEIDELQLNLKYQIIPLIREYYKDGIISVESSELEKKIAEWKAIIQ